MIDTHLHLLLPERFRYDWVTDFSALQGRFGIEEFQKASLATPISEAIFMEVDVAEEQAADEARFFCQLAEEAKNRLLGVIAAARPEHEGFAAYLDSIAHPRLLGIRRVLHTQPDGLSQTELFRKNLRLLGKRGLPFDLCVRQRQLGLALQLVRACPETTFVLDHCGVPEIATNRAPTGAGFLAWQKAIRSLAAEPNVCGKISGLTVYASEGQRTPDDLRPYVETVVESFGNLRCVWGGDWPVVNLGSGLARWSEMAREMIASTAGADAEAILSGNARRIYHPQP